MRTHFKVAIFFCIVMTSCDPSVYLNFYIKNNCEQSIIVKSKIDHSDGRGIQTRLDTINPFFEKKINKYESILGFDKSDITIVLKELEITRDGQGILFNPLDISKWFFIHSSEFQYDAILEVNPENFKQ